MPRNPKPGDTAAQEKPKRSAAKRSADERYSAKNRENQRENFGNIGATFRKSEKFAIKSIYNAAGITPAQVIRAAWFALITDGEPAAERIRNDAETARAAYAERLHHQQNARDATTTDTTGPGTPNGSNPGTVTG